MRRRRVIVDGYLWNVATDGSFTPTGAPYNVYPDYTTNNCSGTPFYAIGTQVPQVLDRDAHDPTHGVVITGTPVNRTIHSAAVPGSPCTTGLDITVPTVTATDVTFVPVPPPAQGPVAFG